MTDLHGLAHEIWAVALKMPNEGIEDSVGRIKRVLERELTEFRKTQGETALAQYTECDGDSETDPLERLRFFCSCAMKGQNWLDVERFFNDIRKAQDSPNYSLGEPVRCNPADYCACQFQNLYTSAPTTPEGYLLVAEACREFVRKVECGEARSSRSYKQMKAALTMLEDAPKQKEPE